MTVEQKTFIPQEVSKDLKNRPTISKNGNIFEAPRIAEPKPLNPDQLRVINALKNPFDKFIAQRLVDAREQGKPVTIGEFTATIDISMIKNRKPRTRTVLGKPIIDDGQENDGEKIRTLVGRHIMSLRPKFEPVGLFILNDYHTGKKRESSYVLKTREELAQYRTLKDLSSAIGEPNPNSVRSKFYWAKKKDPTIEIQYLPDGGNSREIYLTQADFEKTIKALATKTIAKNGTGNNKNISNTQDKKPQNKFSTESVLNRKPSKPDEVHERAMLRRPPEQIREELSIHLTNVILSHFVRDCIEELNKSPRELLEKALPPKRRLDEIIKEPPEQFLMDKFLERFLGLWHILDAKSTNSVFQKQAVEYCLELKQKGYNIRDIVDNTCSHFSIPSPFTSVPAP